MNFKIGIFYFLSLSEEKELTVTATGKWKAVIASVRKCKKYI